MKYCNYDCIECHCNTKAELRHTNKQRKYKIQAAAKSSKITNILQNPRSLHPQPHKT